jgi:heme/copper-type cytochrome/quinol oxidase subunit 2
MNFNFGFSTYKSDVLLHLSQWQYWLWFWFSFFWTFYYFLILRTVKNRTTKMNPKMNTSLRGRGKWGDFLIAILPLSWCANILLNSNFILRMFEWQNESSLFTVRIHGKQWYWVYKFDLIDAIDILTVPKNVGRNRWIVGTPEELIVCESYLQAIQLRSQEDWIKNYWHTKFKEDLKTFKLIESNTLNYNSIKKTSSTSLLDVDINTEPNLNFMVKYSKKFFSFTKKKFEQYKLKRSNWQNIKTPSMEKNFLKQSMDLSNNHFYVNVERHITKFNSKFIAFFKKNKFQLDKLTEAFWGKSKIIKIRRNFFKRAFDLPNSPYISSIKKYKPVFNWANIKSKVVAHWQKKKAQQIWDIFGNTWSTEFFETSQFLTPPFNLSFKKIKIALGVLNQSFKGEKEYWLKKLEMPNNYVKKSLNIPDKIISRNIKNIMSFFHLSLTATNFKLNKLLDNYWGGPQIPTISSNFVKQSLQSSNKKFFPQADPIFKWGMTPPFKVGEDILLKIFPKTRRAYELFIHKTKTPPKVFPQIFKKTFSLGLPSEFQLKSIHELVMWEGSPYYTYYSKKTPQIIPGKYAKSLKAMFIDPQKGLMSIHKYKIKIKSALNFVNYGIIKNYEFVHKLLFNLTDKVTKQVLSYIFMVYKMSFDFWAGFVKGLMVLTPYFHYPFKFHEKWAAKYIYRSEGVEFFVDNNFLIKYPMDDLLYRYQAIVYRELLRSERHKIFNQIQDSFIQDSVTFANIKKKKIRLVKELDIFDFYDEDNNFNINIFNDDNYDNLYYNYDELDDTWDVDYNLRHQVNTGAIKLVKHLLTPQYLSENSDLLKFNFFDNNNETASKVADNGNFWVIKQKRYKKKQFVKHSAKRDIEYVNFDVLRNLYRKHIMENIKLITDLEFQMDSYTLFKCVRGNKHRTESLPVHLYRRLLRTKRTLVLPAHINMTVVTNSYDVVHSWFIPGLGIKMDCVPGRSTHHSLYLDNIGFYYGQCAEICGRYHHHMPIRLCALPFEHFMVWWQIKGLPKLLRLKKKTKESIINHAVLKYTW